MIAACTIVGRNALAHARVTADSFRAVHPGVEFVTLLADDPEGLFDPAAESFVPLTLADVAIPQCERLMFRYAQPELSYALTPWLLAHLLDRGFDRVLFFKQETLVTSSVESLFDRLEQAGILVTPHLYAPLDTLPDSRAAAAREREILLAGVYNAGVLGVADRAETRRFLAWWGDRLARHSLRAVEAGMHFEQRWLDFAPSFVATTAVDRRPGSNLGHWRLPESRIHERGGRFDVDGDVLRVARFSGYEPERPEFLTRHHQRVRVADLAAPGQRLVARYREALERSGHAVCTRWPSGSSRFDDGVEIPALARAIHRRLPEEDAKAFGDPHRTGVGSFRAWLATELPPPWRAARIWKHLWDDRDDLRAAFPQPEDQDHGRFQQWIETFGRVETGLVGARWLPEGGV